MGRAHLLACAIAAVGAVTTFWVCERPERGRAAGEPGGAEGDDRPGRTRSAGRAHPECGLPSRTRPNRRGRDRSAAFRERGRGGRTAGATCTAVARRVHGEPGQLLRRRGRGPAVELACRRARQRSARGRRRPLAPFHRVPHLDVPDRHRRCRKRRCVPVDPSDPGGAGRRGVERGPLFAGRAGGRTERVTYLFRSGAALPFIQSPGA